MKMCVSCALNLMGWCAGYGTKIPTGKESVVHDCPGWTLQRRTNALAIVEGLIETHEEHRALWMVVQDMLTTGGGTPGSHAMAWRLIWTAPYIDDVTRVAIAREVVPF